MRWNEETLRLYAVTDRTRLGMRPLEAAVEEAIAGGATCVQLREKALDADAFLREAKALCALCHRYGVPLLINDSVGIARGSGADGVHLGQSDMGAREARRLLGRDAIIGVTAKTEAQARAAQEAGADYLGSGAIFSTTTKMNASPMSLDTLRAICASVSIPVVAIGGINRGNLPLLRGTGIRGAAVVSGIFAAEDIRAECALLRAMAEEIIE